jgi:hypothetical protein
VLAKIGRWLAAEHLEITQPGQRTRQTCAAWVAAMHRMAVGRPRPLARRAAGTPRQTLSPKKRSYLRIACSFFSDCQDWEWIPRRFDPARALATLRSIMALLGAAPGVIAQDIWAKLLWA